ncbi:LysM peptidoglycan-binding domain-containing protein [Fictibacillus phosphorivorans]|uniref:LysM peptidoglycan-binding domain-containing protein n=1 Tax=Fictibacillus phosphorivorans TaxID=1221500 RepID=UPI00204046E0|nr:LysM peptidoglycan-binding domain-containing protein [Fictibacillus phosphorivorans]MCM3717023.1 LysM peptidoglycan-binding domain-containing protein [Fictibacillus phosphorivorans]MCM3774428.1 LysM peptidoglycan-binding domain-containing protein [Fictibacillus phosphorivorans]
MSQSKLRFSIEESVWLKKGQEVAEVLSMSLNPEINISEEAGQVYIKGALILNGKYRAEKQEDTDGALEGNPLSEGVSYRSLTQLNVAEDGATELVHRFPVDITIPSYRVEDSNQVKVEVESFEYELPNSTCFELSASMCIYGIKDEKQRQESQAFELPKETIRSAVEERSNQNEEKSEIFTPFQFEARQSGGIPPSQPQQNEFQASFRDENTEVRSEKKTTFEFKPHFEEVDDTTMDATFDSLKSIAFSNEDMRDSNEEEEREEETEEHYFAENEEEQEELNYNESYTEVEEEYVNYDQPYNEEQYQAQNTYNQQNPYQYQPSYQPERPYEHNPYQQQAYSAQENNYQAYQEQHSGNRPYDSGEYGEQIYHDEPEQEYDDQSYQHTDDHDYSDDYQAEASHYEEQEEQHEEQEEQHEEREETKDENALYLTKMLSGKEERFSKMKMYILQRGDSLEHICERYDISLNTLMRMNRLQQGEVSEGQIIYIPVSSR